MYKIAQCVVNTITYEQNRFQLVFAQIINIRHCYNNEQLQQKLYICKIYIANMFQIKERTKNYIVEEKYYKYKNIIRNRKHCNNNYIQSALNKSIKSILDYKSFEEEERD